MSVCQREFVRLGPPDAQGVVVRSGFTPYASGVGTAPVRTLAEHSAGATRRFIAAASGAFYNISAPGPAGAPLASGFASDAWQWTPFLSRLFFVNGSDPAQVYNGTSFANAAFTGVAPASLIGVAHYQQRLFFGRATRPGSGSRRSIRSAARSRSSTLPRSRRTAATWSPRPRSVTTAATA